MRALLRVIKRTGADEALLLFALLASSWVLLLLLTAGSQP